MPSCRPADLTRAGNLERRLLNLLGDFVEAGALQIAERAIDHTRPRNADGHDTIGFPDAVERAGHEGVVAHRIGENHQLGTGNRAAVSGLRRSFLHHFAHAAHCIHVDARA